MFTALETINVLFQDDSSAMTEKISLTLTTLQQKFVL